MTIPGRKSQLTSEQATRAREVWGQGGSLSALAKAFDVSYQTVYLAAVGKTHKDLPPAPPRPAALRDASGRLSSREVNKRALVGEPYQRLKELQRALARFVDAVEGVFAGEVSK